MSTLIPDPNLLAIESISCADGEIVLRAHTIRDFVQCPVCRQPTNKVHSQYGRTPADLPWEGIRVRCLSGRSNAWGAKSHPGC